MAIGPKLWKLWEKIDDVVGIAAIVQIAGQKALERFKKRVGEKIGLGESLEEARKTFKDELFYNIAVAALLENEGKELDEFEIRLRADVSNNGAKKAECMVLFVANYLFEFEREVKETTSPEKGKSGPRIEQTYKDLAKGIEHAKNFLHALLRNVDPGGDVDETYKLRMAFLQGKNVFSFIKPPRKKDWIDKLIDGAFNFSEEAFKAAGKKVQDTLNDLDSVEARLQAKYDALKAGR